MPSQNVYATKNRTSKYTQQKLLKLKGEIDKAVILIDNFNTPLSVTDTTQ